MSPEEIAKGGSESQHQQAFMAWCAMACFAGIAAANNPDCYVVKGLAKRIAVESHAETSIRDRAKLAALKWIHAIPNGGSRGDTRQSAARNGAIMKAEGVKIGISDIFFPFPHEMHAGLYIEMKVGNNKPSDEQKAFLNYASTVGYQVAVCYSWREAVDVLLSYLKL